jgi:eukaryotic-like serine/threonine-protein kinase
VTADLRDHLQLVLSGSYTIERELGGGGMSRVFLAEETRLHRKVVVKVLSPELAAGVSVARFAREIATAARLQQANIVPVLATGEADGIPYYTMPYVNGESLRAQLSRGGIPFEDASGILRDVARALAYAHGEGIVHRDIKPENILLSSGTAVVTDFGIAKAISDARTSDGAHRDDGTLTQVGSSVGSPRYMAPEQAAGDAVDHRADLYAWGLVAYEVLSGTHPFAGRTTAPQLIAAQIAESPRPLGDVRPDLPSEVAALVMQCLAKRPADRPESAAEVLRRLTTTPTPAPHVPARDRPARARRRAVVAGIATIAAVALVVFAVRRGPGTATDDPTEMTLAVLPIENAGGDSTTEYLADGMTGELSNQLSKVPGLQVVGDVSTFRFKGTHTPPTEVARQLGVRMLLTGRLQPGLGRVRLQMQLSDRAGKLLWSNTFDHESRDNFAVEDSITHAIANEMRLVLSPTTIAVTRAGRTENPDAHNLYLKGQYEKNKVTPQGLESALGYFKEALKLDSNYAQAWVGVAFSYDMLADVYRPSHQYHMLAYGAAKRAVQTDSLLAEARMLNGYELAAGLWDLDLGRAEMERALAMNPKSPDALFVYGMFLWLTGDNERAVELADRLIQIDPLSPLAARLKSETLMWGGRYQESLVWDSVARRLDPMVVIWESTSGHALRELNRLAESEAALLDFQKTFGKPSVGLAITYARLGRRAEAVALIGQMEAARKLEWVDPSFIAWAWAGIGDADRAMQWLQTAFDEKAWTLRAMLNWDSPFLRSLRDDPRFVALKRRVLETKFGS